MIADEIINEIRNRADIVAVIGQHVQLRKAGRNWKGLCPFHGEKTPSFNVSPDKGFFHCFGCQKHGDVFTFVMELEGKSFVEAAEQLGARFGVAVPKIDESPELARQRGERRSMLEINKHATAFFREVLADPKRGEMGRAYLAKRGVGAEVTDKFQLGYAPPDWHALADYLKNKRCDMELAVKLGLVRRQTKAGGYYDGFRDRLVCPVIVTSGDVVGFSARVIGKAPPGDDGYEPPKYINSPESPVYKKSQLLFGIAQAREAIQKNGRAVLVEGNFDVISLHQAGFTDVVAPLGTAITSEQVLTLKRLSERIVLLYDGDKAGYKASMHALQLCVEAEVEVLVAARPGNAKSGGSGGLVDGMDPDSLVAGGGAEQLREAIDRARGGIEFFAYEVWGTKAARTNADARARALDEAAKLIARIENPTKRDMVIHTTALALEIDTSVIRTAVGRAAQRPATGPGSRGQGGGQGRGPQPGGGHPNAPWPEAGHDSRRGDLPDGRHPNSPDGATADARGAGSRDRDKTPVRTLDPEVEVLSLLADHPNLLSTPDADRVSSLLTEPRLQAMYSAARAGQSFLELVSLMQLPPPTAQHVLSGKYAESKDPSAQLRALLASLEQRASMLSQKDLAQTLSQAKRGGMDPELVRLQAQLAVAQRKGDRELVEQLMAQVNAISSNRKQAD
ncbi:MAG TPA: DNA primase [Kofleriaceae bacterium]|nr:DNA primase [Kofleriaceae bacterium]